LITDLFDSPWKILIVAVVLIVLFGSRKLPQAARSLGQSMRILKTEVQGLHEDEPAPLATQAAPTTHAEPQLAPAPVPYAEAQIQALQAHAGNLQEQVAAANGHRPYAPQAGSPSRGAQEMG
jgi:sec-independent protein translocase protein TatA